MKKIVAVLAASVLLSGVASAREVSVGLGSVDPDKGKSWTQTEVAYKSAATLPKVGVVDYVAKAELAKNARTLGVAAGRKLAVKGATVTPSLELGAGERDVFIKKKKSVLVDERSYGFWGAGVTAEYPLTQKLTAEGQVRYRESLTDDVKFDETRVGAGVNYSLAEDRKIGLQGWQTDGTVKATAVAVKLSQKF